MRYRTRERRDGVLILLAFTFLAPFLLAVPVIASIGYLHHNWWSAIPVMHYWTAYWWEVIAIGLGGAVWLILDLVAGGVKDRF